MSDSSQLGSDRSDSTASGDVPVPQTTTSTWPVGYSMGAQVAASQAIQAPPGARQSAVAPQGSQTSSSAIVALVLAIASWVVCPLILAIIALVFASKADREIATAGGAVQGGGLITAAKIVAWINIGIYVAILVVMVIIFIIVLIAGAWSQVTPAGQV
jgi:hypothetical protein